MSDQQKLREAVARVLCYNRAAPACDCRERGVPCRAPIETLLTPTNAISSQSDAAIAACRPFHRAEALEEAAAWIEAVPEMLPDRQELAAAIRALIPSESETGERDE